VLVRGSTVFWQASQETAKLGGTLPAATTDGATVRGTATFVDDNSLSAGPVETAEGTFAFTCPA
jgi:hypothetical protein